MIIPYERPSIMSTLSRPSWLSKSPGGSEFTPTRTQSPSTTGPEIVQVLNSNCERTQQAYAGSVVGVKALVVPNRDSGELDCQDRKSVV